MATAQKATNPSAVLRQAAAQFSKLQRATAKSEKIIERKDAMIAKLRETLKAVKAKGKTGKGPVAKKVRAGKVAAKKTRASKVEAEDQDDEVAPRRASKKTVVKPAKATKVAGKTKATVAKKGPKVSAKTKAGKAAKATKAPAKVGRAKKSDDDAFMLA